jgi:hypothetical protein
VLRKWFNYYPNYIDSKRMKLSRLHRLPKSTLYRWRQCGLKGWKCLSKQDIDDCVSYFFQLLFHSISWWNNIFTFLPWLNSGEEYISLPLCAWSHGIIYSMRCQKIWHKVRIKNDSECWCTQYMSVGIVPSGQKQHEKMLIFSWLDSHLEDWEWITLICLQT